MATASSSGLSSVLHGGVDTIVARATPAGRGALAVIRVSGPETAAVAQRVCPEVDTGSGWRAGLATLRGASGETLETAVVVAFPGPRSYTGEDMLEVTLHGSPYLVEAVIDAFIAAGARRAGPGEFTRRAVANGKLDLVQAEAVQDLIRADVAWQVRLAREQLAGTLSRRFAEVRSALVCLLASLEASLDFAERDVVVEPGELERQHDRCRGLVEELLATASAGARIRDGVRVVILGGPNTGKSTLFNNLCGSERAIVSPHPGTTRDVLEAELDLEGVRMVIQDTAGLRSGGDEVEKEGRRRAVGAAASAAVVLLLWPTDACEGEEAPETPAGVAVLRVRSKADLAAGNPLNDGWLAVSCHTGEGLEALRERLVRLVAGEIADLGGEVAIAERHRKALEQAMTELEACDLSRPELAAEGVRWALRAVQEMTGEVDSDEVLDGVFSAFCIGK